MPGYLPVRQSQIQLTLNTLYFKMNKKGDRVWKIFEGFSHPSPPELNLDPVYHHFLDLFWILTGQIDDEPHYDSNDVLCFLMKV